MARSVAPWPSEVVECLNARQARQDLHPYTCPNDHGVLLAAEAGWRCPKCNYRQDWADYTHTVADFMESMLSPKREAELVEIRKRSHANRKVSGNYKKYS